MSEVSVAYVCYCGQTNEIDFDHTWFTCSQCGRIFNMKKNEIEPGAGRIVGPARPAKSTD